MSSNLLLVAEEEKTHSFVLSFYMEAILGSCELQFKHWHLGFGWLLQVDAIVLTLFSDCIAYISFFRLFFKDFSSKLWIVLTLWFLLTIFPWLSFKDFVLQSPMMAKLKHISAQKFSHKTTIQVCLKPIILMQYFNFAVFIDYCFVDIADNMIFI